jgi:acyl-CoA synthetase (NDP forming)
MTGHSTIDLKLLFKPRSIAIVGASNDEVKSGGMFMQGILKDGFSGKIFPVNRKEQEVKGIKCYPSLGQIPGEVDLAVLAIPAKEILTEMEECARKKVKFAIVHAVGFSEMGPEGKDMERKMVGIAREGGVRIVGPNCMGVYTSHGRINTVLSRVRLPFDGGGIGFVGQSGWASEVILRSGNDSGLRFNGVISIGNQSDLTIEDFMEYWGADPEIKVIAAYIEGLKQPQRFMEMAKKICRHKPVIVWKGGSSEMGVRSAASHTGSMAGSYQVFQAMCKQTGIIPAYNLQDVLDLIMVFNCPVLPAGKRLGLLIEAGGGAVASLDASVKEGLVVPRLSEELQARLAEYLKGKAPPSANRKNPVDLVFVPKDDNYPVYVDSLEMMLSEVDICLMIAYLPFADNRFRQAVIELRDKYKKPVILMPGNAADQIEGMIQAVGAGIPCYTMPENAIRSIGSMVRRTEYLNSRSNSN